MKQFLIMLVLGLTSCVNLVLAQEEVVVYTVQPKKDNCYTIAEKCYGKEETKKNWPAKIRSQILAINNLKECSLYLPSTLKIPKIDNLPILCGSPNPTTVTPAGTSTTVSSPPKKEKENLQWTLVTAWPQDFPVFNEGCQKFAEDVRTMSDNQLDIQVVALNEPFEDGDKIGTLSKLLESVKSGKIQMGHSASYYWAKEIPGSEIFTAVPFGMTAKGYQAWLYSGGGLELWRNLYAKHNLVPFPMGNTGVQMGGWFNKKIENMKDFEGLKMRIPGLGGKVLKKAGGEPITLVAGAGEIVPALKDGKIDASEWIGPHHDKRLELFRVAKYYYYPGWHEPATTLELIINKQAWDGLPSELKPQLQKIIEVASGNINQWIYAQFETLNPTALKDLREKQGVTVLPFPPNVLTELQRLTKEVMKEEAKNDTTGDFKRIYDAYEKFRTKNEAWSQIADECYQNALKGVECQ